MSHTDHKDKEIKASFRSSETQATQEMVPFDAHYSSPVRNTHNQFFSLNSIYFK